MTEVKSYQPKVSIIIPAYNASNYLAEAIDSALKQTYKNIEILVINDGSKDNGATREIAERYVAEHMGIVRYIEKENGGSSSALNTGIRNMKGEWFSWLSHDDLYYPDKVEKQIMYINSLTVPKDTLWRHIFFAANDLINDKGQYIRKCSKKNADEMAWLMASLKGNARLIAEPTKYCFHGCSALVHKKVFEVEGAFNETLRLLNDVDMWYRIYVAGYFIHYIPDVLVMGRVHDKQISTSIAYSYHNPEQDMFWARSLRWLKENEPANYELFYLYGRNAFLKTRNKEGEMAFEIARRLRTNRAFILTIQELVFKLKAFVRQTGKKFYLIFIKAHRNG